MKKSTANILKYVYKQNPSIYFERYSKIEFFEKYFSNFIIDNPNLNYDEFYYELLFCDNLTHNNLHKTVLQSFEQQYYSQIFKRTEHKVEYIFNEFPLYTITSYEHFLKEVNKFIQTKIDSKEICEFIENKKIYRYYEIEGLLRIRGLISRDTDQHDLDEILKIVSPSPVVNPDSTENYLNIIFK